MRLAYARRRCLPGAFRCGVELLLGGGKEELGKRTFTQRLPESTDVFQLVILNVLNTAQKELSGRGGNRDWEERNLCAG